MGGQGLGYKPRALADADWMTRPRPPFTPPLQLCPGFMDTNHLHLNYLLFADNFSQLAPIKQAPLYKILH